MKEQEGAGSGRDKEQWRWHYFSLSFIIFYLYPYLIRQTVIRQIHLYYVFITIYKVLLNVPPVQHLHPTYHFL